MENVADFFTLDKKGFSLAVLFGILIFFFGKEYGLLFLIDIIIFLVLSSVVTKFGKIKKRGIGAYEIARGWKNVLSNGIVPVIIAFLYFMNSQVFGYALPIEVIAAAYIASIAAVIADKFASEIGVLDGEPTMLLTLKKVKKGTSGGVTALGTCASLIASFIISLSVFGIAGASLLIVVVAFFSGFFGCVVDSVLGYFEEQGIGNKYTSNFFCALGGSAMCMLVMLLFSLH
jgi:uncharacterized protein (TIGR00297 family)